MNNIPKICTKSLSVNHITKTFSTEISELQNFVPRYSVVLQSDLGTEATFLLINTEIDNDGDIVEWLYFPTATDVEANPRLAGWSLHILND